MERVISRKYEVLGPLGQGGMSVVYKVRHTALETVLALKALPRDLTANPEMISRFYREARVMARLRHPNIIRVLDIEHDDTLDFHYFVMEYIQGKTLRQYMQEQGSLPLPDVLTIATQVARALVYAHAHTPPIVHRDIKPANIMIEDGSSRVVVMDFGIAKELGDGEMTRSDAVLGTLKYCSPEQLRREPVDGAADVYALGMVMYEAYTGRQFFAGLDETEVIGKVLYEPGENEPQFTLPPPPPFAALVRKAIAKSRERRYRRMDDLLRDIESCFASLNDNVTVIIPTPEKTEAAPGAWLSASVQGRNTGADMGYARRGVESAAKAEPDEDRWEIGERTAAPEPPSPPPRPRSRTLLTVGVGVLVLLAFAGWFGRPLLQQPLSPPPETLPSLPPAPPFIPPPLTLSRIEPQTEAVQITEGETASFAVHASGAEPLQYEWTVDGEIAGAHPTFTWKAQGEGQHRVQAVVRDQAGFSTSQEWQVAVVAPPPTVTPPSSAPPAPKNTPPHIAQQLPVERAVSTRAGETIEFSALALDPDAEEVVYHWSVDGKRIAQGDRFSYAAGTAGKHRVELEVMDKGGLKDTFRWEVQVDAPPAAPRVTMYTPHKESIRLYAHLSRFFGVEVEVPGMNEAPIRYEWRIDGRPVAGRELLEFKDRAPGRHEVEVTATGPSGASVSRKWTVDVQERQESDAQGPAGPPHLAIFALDNEVSADKKHVVVKGKLRNVGERDAENVIVWISALDPQQGLVSRRLALPAPQPLFPGQVATFQTTFNDRAEIADFRVEIVSK